jgi:hypothetical protein
VTFVTFFRSRRKGFSREKPDAEDQASGASLSSSQTRSGRRFFAVFVSPTRLPAKRFSSRGSFFFATKLARETNSRGDE